MVGDTVLGVVVGADLLRTTATTNSRATGSFELGDALFLLDLPQLGAEIVQTDLAIALLVALLGGDSGDARRLVD